MSRLARKNGSQTSGRLPRVVRLVAALSGLVVLASCGSGSNGGQGSIGEEFALGSPQGTVRLTVGSKDFTEQKILGEMAMKALEAAGAEVIDKTGLGTTEDVRLALVQGDIDVYWEYTGTGWLVHLAEPNPIADSQKLYKAVAKEDSQQNGIAWLAPAPANNTYAIAVRNGAAAELGTESISDLKRLINQRPEQATLCVGPEFNNRADGLPGLEDHYGFQFSPEKVFVLSPSTVYPAVDKGEKCNFGSVFMTNGRVEELDLRLLDDDREFFAAYNPAPVLREETLTKYPDLEGILGPISEKLDTDTLRQLSASVEVDGNSPELVAERWLRENGFIG